MKITGAGMNFPQDSVKMPQNEDSISKSIQSRIEGLQKQLQQLSEKEDMDPKEKLKKKQEIEQQITELQAQLNQRRQEKKQEQAENAEAAFKRKYDRYEYVSSNESMDMKNAISAGVSMEKASVYGSVSKSLQGKANIMESEIQLDGARGASTEQKQAEVAELRARAREASAAQIGELAEAQEKSADSSSNLQENQEKSDKVSEEKEDRIKEQEKLDEPQSDKKET